MRIGGDILRTVNFVDQTQPPVRCFMHHSVIAFRENPDVTAAKRKAVDRIGPLRQQASTGIRNPRRDAKASREIDAACRFTVHGNHRLREKTLSGTNRHRSPKQFRPVKVRKAIRCPGAAAIQ